MHWIQLSIVNSFDWVVFTKASVYSLPKDRHSCFPLTYLHFPTYFRREAYIRFHHLLISDTLNHALKNLSITHVLGGCMALIKKIIANQVPSDSNNVPASSLISSRISWKPLTSSTHFLLSSSLTKSHCETYIIYILVLRTLSPSWPPAMRAE